MHSRSIKNIIEDKLKKAFTIEKLEVSDRSHLHKHHRQLQDFASSESHIHIVINSPNFKDYNVLQKHKAIYDVLKNEIAILHAISIDAT